MRITGLVDDLTATAWRDTYHAVRRMGEVFIAAGIVLLVLDVAEIFTRPSRPPSDASYDDYMLKLRLWGFVFGIMKAFVLAPVAIAVHRYVLLGEVTARYVLNPADRRFMRFFLFGVLFEVILFAPGVPSSLMGVGRSVAEIYSGLALFAVLLVIAWIVSLRLLILFPAVAVDASGIHWRNALRDSKGHVWQIFETIFVTALPFWILLQLRGEFLPTWLAPPISLGVKVPIELLMLAALAAAASGLYRTCAHQLGRPLGLKAVASLEDRVSDTKEGHMSDTKIPIFRTALASWRDGLAALRAMPTITAFVFAVMIADTAADGAVRQATTPETMVPMLLLRLAIAALCSFAGAPATIAIHRYVLLGEITRRYVLNLSSRRFRMFFAYSALVNLLMFTPLMLAKVATDTYIIAAITALGFIALAILVGTLILFPAIAVDAPGIGIRSAVQDIHVFPALLILIVTVLPPLAMFGALSFAIWGEETPSEVTWDWIFHVVLVAAVSSVLFAVLTAMASHLYRAWAFRLGWPSGVGN